MNGRQLENLLGHCTFVALIRREALRLFNDVYSFCRTWGLQEATFPSVVKDELEIFRGLPPLLRHHMQDPWSQEFYMCEAPEGSGGGLCGGTR